MGPSAESSQKFLSLVNELNWSGGLISLHVLSDVLIALSYFSIPLAIFYFIRQKNIQSRWIPMMFAALMISVALTHAFMAWNLWFPHYWISGSVKLLCAVISLVSSILVWLLMPQFLRFPTVKDMKELNWQLQEANENLEGKVQERTNQLEMMNQELSEINSVISHDFKNSLNSIVCFSEVVKISKSLEQAQNSAEEIKRVSWRLNDLIDNLRALVKIGDKKIEITEVDLNHVWDEVVEYNSVQLENSGAKIEKEDLQSVKGVHSLLYDLFTNLFNNSMKYRSQEEDLLIRVYPTITNDFVFIHFEDNGIGISEHECEDIFQMYYRGSASQNNDQDSGSGIGLGFCRKVTRLHGGDIWAEVDGNSNSGAHFIIKLPKSRGS